MNDAFTIPDGFYEVGCLFNKLLLIDWITKPDKLVLVRTIILENTTVKYIIYYHD